MEKEINNKLNNKTYREYLENIANFIDKNDIEGALTICRKAISYDPQQPDAYYELAILYYLRNEFEDAINCFENVIRLDKSNIMALNNLGVICYKTKRYEDAIHYLEKAMLIDPNNSDAWYNLGRVFLQLRKIDKVVDAWKQCLYHNPQHNSARKMLKILPPEKIRIIVKAMPYVSLPSVNKTPLKIMCKDYSGCQLVREEGKLYITRGELREQFRVNLVGARWSNHPWGMENEVYDALDEMGCEIIDTDFRKDFNLLPKLLMQDAHLTFVLKGDGIPNELIKQIPGISALWYPDDLLMTEHGCRDIAFNGNAFDLVYGFSRYDLKEYEKYGINNIKWLPFACNPHLHRKLNLPKIHDVCFVGNIYPNRFALLERLGKRFNILVTQAYTEEMVRIFNQSKIVLNLGIGKGGIQHRVFEALACGSLLFTNIVSPEEQIFKDRVHLIYYNEENIENLLSYYLSNDKDREMIAARGRVEVLQKHTFKHRLQRVFQDILNLRIMQENVHKEKTSFALASNITSSLKAKVFYKPYKRDRNNPLRIFASFRNFNWEDNNLQPALENFGEVVRFNWHPPYNQYDQKWHFGDKQQMNAELLRAVQTFHREKPFDVFFSYMSGRTVFPGIIRTINMMGIPTLNICLDDKIKFYGALESTGYAGMADIASTFALCWTSTEDALRLYESVGARAIYLPEGANPDVYKTLNISHDIDVSFVGQCYGQRPLIIECLKNKGVNVQTFGRGWPSGAISVEDMVRIYNRSRINLGFATVGDSKDICHLKARDFEIPMSGGLYLTQYHAELKNVYDIGKEIICYKNIDDLVEKIQYYLAHPQEAADIRQAGLQRARNEHTWEHRFKKAFAVLGIRGF